jgi:thiosulfate dehydrogenase [quinone] large subunit
VALSRLISPGTHVEDPPLARLLFSNTRMAWFWLVVRLYVGWAWLEAGLHKLEDPKWMVDGTALLGYWKGRSRSPRPRPGRRSPTTGSAPSCSS